MAWRVVGECLEREGLVLCRGVVMRPFGVLSFTPVVLGVVGGG